MNACASCACCGRGVTPGADRPDRLVGDHCFLQFLWIQTGETAAQLDRQYFFHIAFVALLERFSDANNRTQFRFVRGAHLAIDHFIRLTEQRAAFAVAEHDVMHKQIAQKRSADLAGKRAALLPIHILRADLDVLRSAKASLTFAIAVNGGMITTSTSVISPMSRRNDSTNRADSRLRHVHLPIGGDDFFAHVI